MHIRAEIQEVKSSQVKYPLMTKVTNA